VVFFFSAAVIGLVSAGLLASDRVGALLSRPWFIAGIAIAAGVTGAVGWWLGEKVVLQLRRAGKLDAEE
jgi:energy-coupling factor transport system substrate-specific component